MADYSGYWRWLFDWRYGLFGLRVGHFIYSVKAPWCRPLFSERYGYRPVLFRAFGWRLLARDLRKQNADYGVGQADTPTTPSDPSQSQMPAKHNGMSPK